MPSTDPLGTDLQLSSNGDLLTNMAGSLSLVSNELNVAQSVRIKFTTVPYTYLFGDGVGSKLSQYVDGPINDVTAAEIRNIIFTDLTDDNRIEKIQAITIDDSSNGILIITIQAVVATIGPAQIPLFVSAGG